MRANQKSGKTARPLYLTFTETYTLDTSHSIQEGSSKVKRSKYLSMGFFQNFKAYRYCLIYFW